jgi:hypothetical protein
MRLIISFDLPTEVSRGFPALTDALRRHIIRQSIRSALIPARDRLKAKLMSLTSKSRQSSGATLRALTTKYANSRRSPDRFYGIVGVNRHIVEYFDPEDKSPVYKKALMRQVNFGLKTGRFNQDGSPVYSRRWKPMEVRSFLARRYGVKGGITSRHRKRRPNNYLRFIERGFNATDSRGPWAGKRTRFFAGHHFVQKTFEETQAEVRDIFRHKVIQHFRKVFLG